MWAVRLVERRRTATELRHEPGRLQLVQQQPVFRWTVHLVRLHCICSFVVDRRAFSGISQRKASSENISQNDMPRQYLFSTVHGWNLDTHTHTHTHTHTTVLRLCGICPGQIPQSCSTEIMSSISSLPLNSLLGTLSCIWTVDTANSQMLPILRMVYECGSFISCMSPIGSNLDLGYRCRCFCRVLGE